MGASDSKPDDLTPGFVGFEIHHVPAAKWYKRLPKEYILRLEAGIVTYNTTWKSKTRLYIGIDHMRLRKEDDAAADPGSFPCLEYVPEKGFRARNADINGPDGKSVCNMRFGKFYKFSYRGREYRWQWKPAANWIMGFPDKATLKLVEMEGDEWLKTVASLHMTNKPESGHAATLYMPATNEADWQDLVVMAGMVAMQHVLIIHQSKRNPSDHTELALKITELGVDIGKAVVGL